MRRVRESVFDTERRVVFSAHENAAPKESTMRDVYELLREKESAVQRVAREIEILRLAAPLLTDDVDTGLAPAAASTGKELARAQELHSRVSGAAPSLVTSEVDSGRTGGPDVEKLVSVKKISARLKRLARPLVNTSRFAAS